MDFEEEKIFYTHIILYFSTLFQQVIHILGINFYVVKGENVQTENDLTL